MAIHNKEYKELAAKILAYEKRVDALIEKKKETKEGPDLENISSEISELQKDLVGIKKRRRQLRDHVSKNHPKDEILDDLSILKDTEQKKLKNADPAVEAKLDDMLKKLRNQYARSRRDDMDEYAVDEKAIAAELDKKKKNIQKEKKDEYIKENINTKLKVD